MDKDEIRKTITRIISAIGEDPTREGLVNTPSRVARSYEELLSDYRVDPQKLINGALINVENDETIVVRAIEFVSLCEYHILPFIGLAHFAYILKKEIIGLSKIPRIVNMFAHRLLV
jgi:GTP cyclohydrolase I